MSEFVVTEDRGIISLHLLGIRGPIIHEEKLVIRNTYVINAINELGTLISVACIGFNGDFSFVPTIVKDGELSFVFENYEIIDDVIQMRPSFNWNNFTHALVRITNANITKNILRKHTPREKLVIYVVGRPGYESDAPVYLYFDGKKWIDYDKDEDGEIIIYEQMSQEDMTFLFEYIEENS